MKTVFVCAAGLLLASAGVRGEFPFASPASLASELRRMEHSLTVQTAEQIRTALPSGWRVRTSDGDYAISTLPLRGLLGRHSERSVKDAHNWLQLLAAELDSYSGPSPRVSDPSTALARILARPEFSRNAAPNAWERFWERVGMLLARWLKWLFGFSRVSSATSTVFFWVALTVAVCLIAFLFVRRWNRDGYELNLPRSRPAAAVRGWQLWVAAAHSASNEGDLRRAIQCAYWGGVARLQEWHALPEDTTYTPREYLRLLASAPQRPGTDQAIVPLRTLTSHLERSWYGRAAATVEDFSVCLGSLEALGCQVD